MSSENLTLEQIEAMAEACEKHGLQFIGSAYRGLDIAEALRRLARASLSDTSTAREMRAIRQAQHYRQEAERLRGGLRHLANLAGMCRHDMQGRIVDQEHKRAFGVLGAVEQIALSHIGDIDAYRAALATGGRDDG